MGAMFLNRWQREQVLMLAGITETILQEIMPRWKGLDNKTIGELKTARTYILKFLDKVLKSLDRQQVQRIMKDAMASDIICVPKYESKIKKELIEEAQAREMIQVRRGAIELLAENALGHCNPCKAVCTACVLKQIFIELNVPPLEEADQSPDCPYKYR